MRVVSIPCHHRRKKTRFSKAELAIACRKRGYVEMKETLACGLALNQLHF